MTFYTFANATTSIPLANLDANFATPITLGNTAVTINGTFSSIGNLTLNNATIASGNSTVTKETVTTITSPAATNLTIQSAGTTAMTIDTSQNVGIATTSPAYKLNIIGSSNNYDFNFQTNSGTSANDAGVLFLAQSSATAATRRSVITLDPNGANGIGGDYFQIQMTGDGTASFINQLSGPMTFYTNGSERMRIDSSGNVMVGTTTAFSPLTVNGSNRFDTATFGDITTPANNCGIYLRGTGTAGISWAGGGALAFYGTGVGSGERARIDSSGNLLVGYTSSNGSYKLQVNSQIFATSSTIATSDANYKTNVTPLTGALDLVSKLNPVSFNWKQHPVHDFDTQNTTVGFLAQEVQTALSGQVYVNSIIKESEVTLLDKTKEKFLGIAEGNMIAILTKAIQELKAEFDAYKASHP